MKNALILLAGGSGKRLGTKEPKQFIKIGSTSILEFFLSNLEKNIFDIIIIAIKKNKYKYIKDIEKKFYHKIKFVNSGQTRQISVRNSLKFLEKYKPAKVLIHDSARPNVSNNLIRKILKKLNTNKSCIPFVIHNNFMKTKNNIILDNTKIMNIQTPQGFCFKEIFQAHKIFKGNKAKDDSSVFEKIGIKNSMIKGELTNIKITTKEDMKNFINLIPKKFKSGIGYDIHKIDLLSKKKLLLCGVKINHPPLIGHSDADVGYHAVCDSIFGALSMRDIGYYFNDKNKKWKNANSKIFVEFCFNKLNEKKYKIVNLDINFICETPKINNLIILMKKNLSKILRISPKIISIKATTNEKTGIIGRGEAIAAQAIVQVVNV